MWGAATALKVIRGPPLFVPLCVGCASAGFAILVLCAYDREVASFAIAFRISMRNTMEKHACVGRHHSIKSASGTPLFVPLCVGCASAGFAILSLCAGDREAVPLTIAYRISMGNTMEKHACVGRHHSIKSASGPPTLYPIVCVVRHSRVCDSLVMRI